MVQRFALGLWVDGCCFGRSYYGYYPITYRAWFSGGAYRLFSAGNLGLLGLLGFSGHFAAFLQIWVCCWEPLQLVVPPF